MEQSPSAALHHLLRASHLAGPDDLPALTQQAAELLGAMRGTLYLADYEQTRLVPLSGAEESADELSVESTLAGRTFREVARHITSTPEAVVLWLPVLDGTERLGTLELVFPAGTDLQRRPRADDCEDVAAMLAELVITRSMYGDLVEITRRQLPMTLPAELQWNLLPPLTFATPAVAITGNLAPTNEVAGDSFDYALDGDVLHLAIVDAMGHGLEAALLSTVAVAALRNGRRSGLELADLARSIDRHVSAQFRDDRFVTAILAELDWRTGTYRWLTAGHPPAVLLRKGRAVKQLMSGVHPPLGLLPLGDQPLQPAEERLEPGDRLLLYTDGVVEARSATGEFFGFDRLVDFLVREALGDRPLPETMRRLSAAVLAHQEGALDDDATTVLVEWSGDVSRLLP